MTAHQLERPLVSSTSSFSCACARYDSNKNQFGLVSAFDEVAARHPEAHLLMAGRVGEPVYAAQVRQAWQRLAARDRVHPRDHATDPALLLAAADGFVLNSFFEGGPLVTMEALHAGVPVVVSDVGGARDQLGSDPSRGYLIRNPLGDPLDANWTTIGSALYARQINRDELIEAMCALVREREQRAAKRDQLAAESARRFHPDHCLRGHANLLHSCVTGSILSLDPLRWLAAAGVTRSSWPFSREATVLPLRGTPSTPTDWSIWPARVPAFVAPLF